MGRTKEMHDNEMTDMELAQMQQEDQNWQELQEDMNNQPTVDQLPEVKRADITKQHISDQLGKFGKAIDLGEITAIEAMVFAKYLEEMAKGLAKLAGESAVNEFDQYGEKEIRVNGVKIEKRETGVKYDFSNTERWNDIKAKEDKISKERKAFEAQLKTFRKACVISIEDELVDVNPPIKTSSTSIVRSIS